MNTQKTLACPDFAAYRDFPMFRSLVDGALEGQRQAREELQAKGIPWVYKNAEGKMVRDFCGGRIEYVAQ